MYGWVFASENSIPVIPEEEEGAKEGTGVEFRQMLNMVEKGTSTLAGEDTSPYWGYCS